MRQALTSDGRAAQIYALSQVFERLGGIVASRVGWTKQRAKLRCAYVLQVAGRVIGQFTQWGFVATIAGDQLEAWARTLSGTISVQIELAFGEQIAEASSRAFHSQTLADFAVQLESNTLTELAKICSGNQPDGSIPTPVAEPSTANEPAISED